MSTTTNTSNGAAYTLPVAQVKSLPPGANSPAQAALINQQNDAAYQSRVAKLGGRHKTRGRRYRKGGTGEVAIYSPTVPYKETGTGDQSITNMNKSVTSTLVQNQANSVYDSKANVKGGSRRRHRRTKTRRGKSRVRRVRGRSHRRSRRH